MGQVKADLFLGHLGSPRKPDFQPPSGLMDPSCMCVLRVARTATLTLGSQGPENSCCGAVGKVAPPFLPPAAFLETGGGRFQGCCLVFVFVWALTLCHALGTVGPRPDPGTVLCCVYVSPEPQESEQEGFPHSWITRLHFCLMWGHLAFMA